MAKSQTGQVMDGHPMWAVLRRALHRCLQCDLHRCLCHNFMDTKTFQRKLYSYKIWSRTWTRTFSLTLSRHGWGCQDQLERICHIVVLYGRGRAILCIMIAQYPVRTISTQATGYIKVLSGCWLRSLLIFPGMTKPEAIYANPSWGLLSLQNVDGAHLGWLRSQKYRTSSIWLAG